MDNYNKSTLRQYCFLNDFSIKTVFLLIWEAKYHQLMLEKTVDPLLLLPSISSMILAQESGCGKLDSFESKSAKYGSNLNFQKEAGFLLGSTDSQSEQFVQIIE